MSRKDLLKYVFSKHKIQLLSTYSLFIVEMIMLLLRPFFLGLAINDLLIKKYDGLIYLCIVHFIYLIVGTIRHIYDTKTYTAIYNTLIEKLLNKKYEAAEISKLSAHTNLAKEFVTFLEADLVYVVEAFFNIIGALIMLAYYNPVLVLPCIIIVFPVIFLSKYYGKKMQHLYKNKNDELEKQVDVITSQNMQFVKKHYDNLRNWQIKISNQEAYNFGIMEFLVLIVITCTLFISKNNTTLLVGNIVGIYSYVLKFLSGMDTIPYTVERFATLKDIVNRLKWIPETDNENDGK